MGMAGLLRVVRVSTERAFCVKRSPINNHHERLAAREKGSLLKVSKSQQHQAERALVIEAFARDLSACFRRFGGNFWLFAI
jgi:hypothetical protein